jgi:hypothetical protein
MENNHFLKNKVGNLPTNINIVIPVAKKDAAQIVALVKQSGRITGYKLSTGEVVSKQQGISMAKAGNIAGVAVAERKSNQYLRTLPDGKESNNLGNLPSISLK